MALAPVNGKGRPAEPMACCWQQVVVRTSLPMRISDKASTPTGDPALRTAAGHCGSAYNIDATQTLVTRAPRPLARSPGFLATPSMRFLFTGSRFMFRAAFPHSVTLTQLRFTSLAVTRSGRDLRQQVCAYAGRTNKKALVSEGFDDKQVLDFVGCGGKI